MRDGVAAAGARGDGAPWAAAPACGVCGSPGWRPAGEICGKRYAACDRCGVVRLYDRVSEDWLELLYGDYYPAPDPPPAQLVRQLANPTFAHRRRRLEAVVPAGHRRIFEVGCGDGNFLASLRRAGWRVGGSEFAPASAAVVRRRHGIDPFVGDVMHGVPQGAPFPVVGAYHVLEHVYHPAEWLDALGRMLEPGGVLHLQVPNLASLTHRLTGAAWASMMFPQHVYFYTPRTLAAVLERHGFEVLSTTTWDPWHGPGTVIASAAAAVRRLRTGRLPWSDRLPEPADPCAAETRGEPATRGRPGPLRTMLDLASIPLARAEAAVGRGAVVDVLARIR
ncbi:MAG TPA: methyltransferase domain-containing protein [Longimicrobium sp.]|nr:methyltransferase domain-containing protein [Longimicrobium sp.]